MCVRATDGESVPTTSSGRLKCTSSGSSSTSVRVECRPHPAPDASERMSRVWTRSAGPAGVAEKSSVEPSPRARERRMASSPSLAVSEALRARRCLPGLSGFGFLFQNMVELLWRIATAGRRLVARWLRAARRVSGRRAWSRSIVRRKPRACRLRRSTAVGWRSS